MTTRYQQLLQQLSQRTRRELGQLADRHTRGSLPRGQFLAVGAAAIARADRRAVTLADVALAAQLMAALGAVVHPLGLKSDADQRKLAGSLASILDADMATVDEQGMPASIRARVERLASNEPLHAASLATTAGMELHAGAPRMHELVGWRRSVSAGACPLCSAWASGGPFGPSVHMARHVGCACVQQVVVQRVTSGALA